MNRRGPRQAGGKVRGAAPRGRSTLETLASLRLSPDTVPVGPFGSAPNRRAMSNVRNFGAIGDGEVDDTRAIQHAVADGDGVLEFPRGTFRITRPIEVPLKRHVCLDGCGQGVVMMAGAGPAFRLVGSHGGTGDPGTIKPEVWDQCLPTIKNLVIEGTHAEADGIELIETMQAVFEGVLIRRVRHGIRLHERNRNVLISHCHLYFNTGVGIFLDRVNLHQINIAGSHISYNRLGGIRIEGSEVRNLQITGNDIEYNNHRAHGTKPEPTAEIYVDTTAEGSSVNELTVASNTIQATVSSGGANIRILNHPGKDRPPGLWTIAGNVIGSQENNVHLTGCYGVVISGNCIYSCGQRNLLIENSSHLTIGTNSFRRHTPSMHTGVRLVNSHDCLINGCTIEDQEPGGQKSGASLLELEQCRRINVSGCQFLGGVPYGVDARDCSQTNISGCTIADWREEKKTKGAIRFRGDGGANLVIGNIISPDVPRPVLVDPGVTVKDNLIGG